MELRQKILAQVQGSDEFNGPFELRASAAGYCPRLMDYELQDPVQGVVSETGAMRMMMGTCLHEMWQKILKDTLGDDYGFIEGEITVPIMEGVSIEGHPDGVIKSLEAVYELKCVSNTSFISVAQGGEPLASHYEQANFYAGALGLPNILFHYFNRDNGESVYLMTPFNSSQFEESQRKFLRRVENKSRGVIEPRPYNDPTGAPCFFCSRKDQCYEGWESEVESFTAIHVAPDSVEGETIRGYSELKKVRLTAEKQEKELRKELGKVMTKLGAKRIDVDGQDIYATFKLGKNNNPLVDVKEKR